MFSQGLAHRFQTELWVAIDPLGLSQAVRGDASQRFDPAVAMDDQHWQSCHDVTMEFFAPMRDREMWNLGVAVGRERVYLSSPQVSVVVGRERVESVNAAGVTDTAPDKASDKLTDKETNIVEALADNAMTAPQLAKAAGYPNNSQFRRNLSELVKRGILQNTPGRGYSRRQ